MTSVTGYSSKDGNTVHMCKLLPPEDKIKRQTNQDMLQNPPMIPFFRSYPAAPFTTNQGYGLNERQTLDMVIVSAPIQNQTQATTTKTYSAPNMNPRTYRGGNVKAMIPYGMARGQVSLLSNLEENKPGKLLIVNNNSVFKHVASEKRKVRIPQRKI